MNPPPRWPGGSARAIAVAGGTVAVELLGSGPPLVLLHGWTLDRRMWRPQLPLARDFLLVGIDRRGFGQSTAAADLNLEASDIAAVAASLGLSRFHLLGMSQGGRVALAFAATARDRLLSLTLQGTALDGVASDDEQVPTRAMAAAAARGDLAAMRARWRGHALMRSTTAAGSALLAEMLADYDGRDLTAPRRGLPVTADCIAGLPCPVTAIVGAEDSGRRHANARALAAAGAALAVIPGSGHLCNIDSPRRFNAEVRGGIGDRLAITPGNEASTS